MLLSVNDKENTSGETDKTKEERKEPDSRKFVTRLLGKGRDVDRT
jgi:hypothetical protein